MKKSKMKKEIKSLKAALHQAYDWNDATFDKLTAELKKAEAGNVNVFKIGVEEMQENKKLREKLKAHNLE